MHTYLPITTEWLNEMPFTQDTVDPTSWLINNGTHSICLTQVDDHGYRMDVRTFDEKEGRWHTIFCGYIRSVMHFRVAIDIADQYFGDLHPVTTFFDGQLRKKRINAILDTIPTAPSPVEFPTARHIRATKEIHDIREMEGKTFTLVYVNDIRDELHFVMADGSEYIFYHEQDCCESVRIEDICGDLSDLQGTIILKAEEVTNYDADRLPDSNESYTWTFYKFATQKGYVDVRWYGESNGYYSERVDVLFIPSQSFLKHESFRSEVTLLYAGINPDASYMHDLSVFTQKELKTHIDQWHNNQAYAYGPVYLSSRTDDSFTICQELHTWEMVR